MVYRILLAVVAAIAVVACTPAPPVTVVQRVEVKVPIPVKAVPPPELVAALGFRAEDLPLLVAATGPGAVSCLTLDGERKLRVMLVTVVEAYAKLRAWAVDPGDKP